MKEHSSTVTQLFQEHKIVFNLPDLSCSHIFSFKSLSRLSPNDRISAPLIQMSLNVFSTSSQRADWRRHHCPLKETWQTAGWLSSSCLQDNTCQFHNFTTDQQFRWLQCKTHMTTRVPSKDPILCNWRIGKSPVPPSASLTAPCNSAEREALARYYPCAFSDKAQNSGDGCRLWHLYVVALTCSRNPYLKCCCSSVI